MENKKIKVFVVPSDTIGGVGFYRSIQPHVQLQEQFPDLFHVTIEPNPNFRDLSQFDNYDIVNIHKGAFEDMEGFLKAMDYWKEKNITTVMDVDDSWDLHPRHPLYFSNKHFKIDQITKDNLRRFDYVTTTTPIFAKKISKFNTNVHIFPNAINPEDSRFIIEKEPSDRLRVGLIMGSSHEYDMKLLDGLVNRLPKEIKDKILFVLCGFDLRGTQRIINQETGEITERPILPEETVWHKYEMCITDNYKICSPQYKQFLMMHVPDLQYPDIAHEHYKRCWTKDINHYYQHYKEIDILLVPLEENDFNNCKSQLKAIEACFSHTGIIASNFGPYTIDLKNIIEKGGTINKDGNALLVDSRKGHKDWARYITKCVESPELVKMLQDNLYHDLHDKYDLRNVTKDRAGWYQSIIKH